MTLIQLIDHLKKVLHDNGDVDMEVMIFRNTDAESDYEGGMEDSDINVDPEAKTITFT